MSDRTLYVALTALGSLLGACAVPADSADSKEEATASVEAPASGDVTLNDVQRATAKYQDVETALADGYKPESPCVMDPAGGGAMGVHYVNDALARQPPDPLHPAMLLYMPTPNGPQLVGVEYFRPVFVNGAPWFGSDPPPPGTYNPAPVLFGQTFDGPMPGHNPQMPWHYDLHVWVWAHNPSGDFAQYNPRFVCP